MKPKSKEVKPAVPVLAIPQQELTIKDYSMKKLEKELVDIDRKLIKLTALIENHNLDLEVNKAEKEETELHFKAIKKLYEQLKHT